MSADNGRINEQMFQIRVTGERLMELLEDALPTPAREPFIDGVPVAILLRQESPLRAAASNPQHGFEELAAVLLLPDIGVPMRAEKRQYPLPLLIGECDRQHSKSLAQMSTEPNNMVGNFR